jgi:hypothetical protein
VFVTDATSLGSSVTAFSAVLAYILSIIPESYVHSGTKISRGIVRWRPSADALLNAVPEL